MTDHTEAITTARDEAHEARYDRSEGRKIFTSGKLFAGDSLCAEAEGIFIAVATERFKALFEERQKREREAE